MLLMFLLSMSFQFIPKVLHEIIGIGMAGTVMLHLFWNRRYFFSFFKGRWNFARYLSAAVNIGLLLSVLSAAITGIIISNHLFNGVFSIYWQRSIMLHRLHTSLPYYMMILIGLHLGLHWPLWRRFLNYCNLGNSLGDKISRLLLFILWLTGIYSSFLHRIGDHLRFKHLFATDATHAPFIIYVLTLIGIIGMYGIAGFVIQKGGKIIFKRAKNKNG